MAPAVLGLGLPSTSASLPEEVREEVGRKLRILNEEMKKSPYDYAQIFIETDISDEELLGILRQRKWDVVMIGMGIRASPHVTTFFEKIINMAHVELPHAKFAFNVSPDTTLEAIARVYPA